MCRPALACCAPSCNACAPIRAWFRTPILGARWRCRRPASFASRRRTAVTSCRRRAVWIPPGVEHAVTVIEDAELLTLHVHQPRGRCGPARSTAESIGWRTCRVLEVSPLLLALACELDARPDGEPVLGFDALGRERRLAGLLLDELRRAAPVRLGVDLPQDKRLRHLCEAVIDDPSHHATLAAWASDSGASARTLPMASIAAELGYASASAFTAMVRRSVGRRQVAFCGPDGWRASRPSPADALRRRGRATRRSAAPQASASGRCPERAPAIGPVAPRIAMTPRTGRSIGAGA